MADLVLDDEWVASLVAASAAIGDETVDAGRGPAVASITIGKTQRATFQIEDGRIAPVPDGTDDDAVDVTVPTTAEQLAAFCDGTESMARAYMYGDVKPVGSTGALLALIGLFENEAFRSALAA